MPARPHIVGYQCAGIIREVGPSVTDRTVGQRVVTFTAYGSHAAIVSVPVGATWLVPGRSLTWNGRPAYRSRSAPPMTVFSSSVT